MANTFEIHNRALQAFKDMRAELLGGAVTESLKASGASDSGTALPPGEIESALTYFIAVWAGHHSRFKELNDYARRKFYEAINGHRDFTAGTPISSWAARARYDKNEVIRIFDALDHLMVM